ncbi:nose resistant to fluoxetine protein 6-like isoform X4 [Nilaparvata lugens]|uniref:nose resistant to fluoxetine protein 6-like isoform X1 n=1 Tax=Nilaparvata lugens TaxID=108931 RepID=UPI00193DEE67|nr:nose resistant to fluoxetine protein 6-like isoform X1 [Nilaparvata lugens]XP_039277677.1 nose resistant to fluoxetine protein 6-like isoform X2 [Nilaparvata lugens]XP_039277678.1 nose resistant to fluoxetine protein 6-like isoform X3 [Nilaparvata lugens]XP_039277679.1 nose resistant to fluoxetine protein 6-like isoform X4 [Nilaparvata lugens]
MMSPVQHRIRNSIWPTIVITLLKTFYKFRIAIFLASCELGCASADSELRRVYELNRDYLPERFKQLGIHGHMDFFAGDQNRSLYVPSFVENEICRNDSQLYLDGIRNYNVWALKMLDASGRVPSGLLNGHYMDLGNFEECMYTAGESPFDINYCLIVMRNLTKTPKSPIDWDSEEREFTVGGAKFLRPYLRIGICLPASCDVNDLNQHYSDVILKYNMTVKLDKHSCTSSSEQEIKFEKLDWFAIFVIVLVGTICIVATINDVLRIYFNFKYGGTVFGLLRCFSFYENGKSILRTSSSEKPLAALHGIRALSTFWIVFAHKMFQTYLFPAINNMQLTTFHRSIVSDLFIYGELSVDNFLLLNGLLLFYSKIKLSKLSNRKFNVLSFYTQRLFRLAPAYFFQILLALSLYRFVNNGPLWKHYIYVIKDNCLESWWTHVIFINNYVMPNKQCSSAFWYLAVDMQLAVFSPLLLIPILKGNKIVPLVVVPLLLILAIMISTFITYSKGYSTTFLNDRLAMREDLFATDYIPTHARISPWLLGVLVGYLLSGEDLKLSTKQAICGWILSIIPFACIFTISRYMHQEGAQYNLTLASIHNGLNNISWAILLSWIIVACETGYAGPIKTFLTWKVFQPFSKLSYTIYLIGPGIQYAFNSMMHTSNSYSLAQTLKDFGGELLSILMLAPYFYLLFEAPFIKLYQIMSTVNMKGSIEMDLVKKENVEDVDNKEATEQRSNSTIMLTVSQ